MRYLDRMYQCGKNAVPWSHIGILMRHLAAAQYHRTFVPISGSLWNDVADSVFDGVGQAGFKSRTRFFFIGLSYSIPTIVFYHFSFLFSLSIGLYCGAEVFGLMRCISLSLSLALPTSFNNNNKIWFQNYELRHQKRCPRVDSLEIYIYTINHSMLTESGIDCLTRVTPTVFVTKWTIDNAFAKIKVDRVKSTIPQIHLFRNDPTIEKYFIWIINIKFCGICFCTKIYLYDNTKRQCINNY